MNDTSPEIEKVYKEIIMAKSNEERFFMGLEMIESGYALMTVGIKMEHPGFSEKEIKCEIIKRLRKTDPTLAWTDSLGLL